MSSEKSLIGQLVACVHNDAAILGIVVNDDPITEDGVNVCWVCFRGDAWHAWATVEKWRVMTAFNRRAITTSYTLAVQEILDGV
jgi:hypothetical protein